MNSFLSHLWNETAVTNLPHSQHTFHHKLDFWEVCFLAMAHTFLFSQLGTRIKNLFLPGGGYDEL